MTKVKSITRIAYKQQPEKGEKGALRRISEWAAGVRYLAGGDGEAYQDMVIYNGAYYLCEQTHTSSSGATPYQLVGWGAPVWTVVTDYKFVCTKGLFIGTGNQGWIADAGRIYHTSGKIELSADGSLMTSNGNFVVDADGNLTAKSGTFAGSLVTLFSTLDGTVTLTTQTHIKSGGSLTLTLPSGISFAGRRLLIADTNFPPYTKSALMFSTIVRVASGYLHGLGEYTGENTQTYSSIQIRGGIVEIVAVPTWDSTSVMWIVASGHDSIIYKE